MAILEDGWATVGESKGTPRREQRTAGIIPPSLIWRHLTAPIG